MSAVRRGVTALLLTMLSAACQPAVPSSSPTVSVEPPAASATASSAAPSPAASEAVTIGPGEAWIAYQGAPAGLSLARPDGSGNHVILGPPGDQLHPDWSPDGSQLAYVQATGDASEIWVTDLAGANPQPLLAGYPSGLSDLFWDNPAWSRDGTRIAMIGYEGDPQQTLPTRSVLAIVTAESRDIEIAGELAFADGSLHSFPRWSPGGDALVFVEDTFRGQDHLGGRIVIVRLTDTGWSTPDPITDVVASPRVDWHPTDDLVVFCTNDVGGVQVTDEPSELFIMRSDGTDVRQITEFGPGAERATQPSWTSDGRIIFTYIAGNEDERLHVALIDADGSDREIAIGPDDVGIGNRPHPRSRPGA